MIELTPGPLPLFVCGLVVWAAIFRYQLAKGRLSDFAKLGLIMTTVAALSLSLLLRVGLLAALPPASAAGALVAAGALGRGAAIVLMATTPTARADGLGASYVRALTPAGAAAGVVVAVALGAAGVSGWIVLAVPAALVMAWSVRHLAMAKIGGIVGDVLGAVEQLGEIAVLMAAGVVARRSWPTLGWWPR
jgi:cobalamin synthase